MLSLLWGPWGAQGEPRGHFLVGFGAILARFFDVFVVFWGVSLHALPNKRKKKNRRRRTEKQGKPGKGKQRRAKTTTERKEREAKEKHWHVI